MLAPAKLDREVVECGVEWRRIESAAIFCVNQFWSEPERQGEGNGIARLGRSNSLQQTRFSGPD
jgi:hypothetical protein